MSDSVRSHRRQSARLPHPWDSPGKNTGVGCHFLLQCMKVKRESEVAQLCPTLSDPMDCSPPGSSVHGIFQARVLEWGAIAFSIDIINLYFILFSVLFINFFYFIILYWFCNTLTWIRHGCTCVPHPEPPSYLPPYPIPLDHPSVPVPSTLYHALNLDWWFISHVIIYMLC